jgi:hypothetical protein
MIIPLDKIEGLNLDAFKDTEEENAENLTPLSIAPMKMREDLMILTSM